jgi:hypothetical protein
MNVAEWLTSTNPRPMLGWLDANHWATRRKLRLFVCGCCRLLWDQIEDARCKAAVEAAERCADGEDRGQELFRLAGAVQAVPRPHPEINDAVAIAHAVAATAYWTEWAKPRAADCADRLLDLPRGPGRAAAEADLLREVFGNPPRKARWVSAALQAKVAALPPERRPPDLLLARDWLVWQGGTVGNLAGTIYAERRYEDLPILADALEDAGCTSPELLDHLRGPGPHVLGCWALDLLLMKR